jgi:hypothetical protein
MSLSSVRIATSPTSRCGTATVVNDGRASAANARLHEGNAPDEVIARVAQDNIVSGCDGNFIHTVNEPRVGRVLRTSEITRPIVCVLFETKLRATELGR